jgi:hypothetical protein
MRSSSSSRRITFSGPRIAFSTPQGSPSRPRRRSGIGLCSSARLESGALWNTFILAARAQALWDLGWEHADQIMSHFERLDDAIGAPEEENVLDAIYDVMPDLSFSSAILERARGRVAMIELEGVAWSDWGRPDRIVSTLALHGMPPAFSTTMIDDVAVCAGPALVGSVEPRS